MNNDVAATVLAHDLAGKQASAPQMAMNIDNPKAMEKKRAKTYQALTALIGEYDTIQQTLEQKKKAIVEAGQKWLALFPDVDSAKAYFMAQLPVSLAADAKRKRLSRFMNYLKTGTKNTEADTKAREAYERRKVEAQQKDAKKGGVLPVAVALANSEGVDAKETPAANMTYDEALRLASKDMHHALNTLVISKRPVELNNPNFMMAFALSGFIKKVCKGYDPAADYKSELSLIKTKHNR